VNRPLALGAAILSGALQLLGAPRLPFTPEPALAQVGSAPSDESDLPTRSLDPPIFYIDTIDLESEPGSSGFRLTFSVPYNQLHFVKTPSGRYEARFDVVAVIRKKDRQVGGDVWRHRVSAAQSRETKSQRKNFTFTGDFKLPPGEYRLEVRMGAVGSESSSKASREIKVRPPSNQSIGLSGVEIGTCADTLLGEIVHPDSAEFSVSMSRRFGDPLPNVCVRGDIVVREDSTGVPLELMLRVLGARNAVIVADTLAIPLAGPRTPFATGVPIEILDPGTYALELAVHRGGDQATAVRQFEIDASRIDLERNYAVFVELAGYYLGQDEVQSLRDVPAGERKARWAEFWKELDPDPGTPENEKLNDFLGRIRATADRFAARGQPGWRTDRGKVFMRYGEPDDVENIPQGFNTPAYEIWRYLALNITFVYSDTSGFGDYVLVQGPAPF